MISENCLVRRLNPQNLKTGWNPSVIESSVGGKISALFHNTVKDGAYFLTCIYIYKQKVMQRQFRTVP